ncbi:MAG: prepilin-type N-terminal cleavage/methylation domain-containing protein [Patescibacteria group bacterium]|jgi:prepilin-type N-terminal cleavage/methylation domain-containing protein
MKNLKGSAGFTLIEVIVSTAVFALFAVGVYGAFQMVIKAVYKSRINIIETALLDEYLEVARNLSFNNVGIINGLPVGVLPHTTTTYRNGIPFLVTIVVRSIDDPFDGTLGGTPNDLAPADYKLVEITAACISCQHPTEATVSTIIPPKDLEGNSVNGAIFIYVTDSHNNPVADAKVHLVNTKTDPNIVIDDVTDKDGYLRVIDTPTGTMAYSITVDKQGFSSDYTSATSTLNPNPTKLPITVSTQQISDTFFSIDQLSSLTVHTINESCEPVGSTSFVMNGNKLIGTPGVYKYSQNLQTGADGSLNVNDLEFDLYNFSVLGGHDLAGSIPITPIEIVAGGHQDLTLVLSPHVSNSLLVKVLDNSNNLPLSDATVKLSKAGFNGTLKTNYGNLSQTDWSGGISSENYSESFPNIYAGDSMIDTLTSPGNISLAKFAGQYVGGGYLESAIFDIGKKVNLLNVLYTSESQPIETGSDSILLQLAMSNSSTDPAINNFVGPDGTASTYYSSVTTTVNTGGQTYRYFRYKVFLSTADQNFTPIFSDFAMTFTSGCTPPGQVFYSGISSGTYTLDVSAVGYDTTSSSVDVSGQSSSTVVLYRSI